MEPSPIDRIVAWAQADEDIRAAILEGSMAAGFQFDELSDYDVNIFAFDRDKYLTDDRWMSQLGDVLLYQKEQFPFCGVVVPTRLILFRDRTRMDLSFWHPTTLSEIVSGNKEYEIYRNGYHILVDKDRLAERLQPADGSGFLISPPARAAFLQTVYDFWFAAYCVARYLSRGDLWYAKLLESRYIKDHLFRMALWNHQAAHVWKPNPVLHTEGKRFEKWASSELVDAVSRCFSPYDVEDTWRSLSAMVELFTRLARQTAIQLDIEYPDRTEQDIISYLQYLKDR